MVVVGDLVGKVRDLSFQCGSLFFQKALADLAELASVAQRAVLQNAFACFEREIKTVECGVALFEEVNDAETLQVVLEPAIRFHALIERVLSRVAKRGVTEIMREGYGFS